MLSAFLGLRTINQPNSGNTLNSVELKDASAVEALLLNACQKLVQAGQPEGVLWLLAYTYAKVGWGIYRAGQLEPDFSLDPRTIIEIRLFGLGGEFYFWSEPGQPFQFMSRWQLDQPAAPAPAFAQAKERADRPNKYQEQFGYKLPDTTFPNIADEWHILWGTETKPSLERAGWTKVSEERGVSYEIPHVLVQGARQLPLRLLVRYYLAYDENDTGLCYFQDRRLVELRDANFNELA